MLLSWLTPGDPMSDVHNVLSSTALLSSCRRMPMASVTESTHLIWFSSFPAVFYFFPAGKESCLLLFGKESCLFMTASVLSFWLLVTFQSSLAFYNTLFNKLKEWVARVQLEFEQNVLKTLFSLLEPQLLCLELIEPLCKVLSLPN